MLRFRLPRCASRLSQAAPPTGAAGATSEGPADNERPLTNNISGSTTVAAVGLTAVVGVAHYFRHFEDKDSLCRSIFPSPGHPLVASPVQVVQHQEAVPAPSPDPPSTPSRLQRRPTQQTLPSALRHLRFKANDDDVETALPPPLPKPAAASTESSTSIPSSVSTSPNSSRLSASELRAELGLIGSELRSIGAEAEAGLANHVGVSCLRAGLWSEAAGNLSRGAAGGSVQALYNLGLALQAGKGRPASPGKAVECWRRGAERGHGGCAYQLGVALLTGYGGLPKDAETGRKWIRLAADGGLRIAATYLGVLAFKDGRMDEAGLWLRQGEGTLASSLLAQIPELDQGSDADLNETDDSLDNFLRSIDTVNATSSKSF